MSTSPLCFDAYVVNNLKGASVLDVGCGHGKWGYLLKKYRDPDQALYVAGIDMFEPHVEALRSEGVYDEVVVGNATSLPYPDKSFDCAVACEVLEHLTQEQGEILIAELKRVTRKAFVVTTPSFSCLRGGGQTLDGFNEFEAHKAFYSLKGFRELGFTQVIGVGHLKLRPWKLAVAFASLGLYFPNFSRYLMGFWFSDGKTRQLYAE